MVLGVHTPEMNHEKSAANGRAAAKKEGLEFPIAIDRDKAAWNAWANWRWPSVYLIDTEGYLRRWWYGELNWKGAGTQKVFAKHIDQLLG